ncbi:hypothetical protein CBS101457_002713 [Exobasidium rhododendri]|nr:hypothetical protein CBS101457_002713 [Exobasidium rhododendri]
MTTTRFHNFDVSSQVFLEGKYTIGIVNLKPIVPLHVLIIPRKEYKRLGDVPREELHDLFDNVQYVSSKTQELVGASACTVSIQDGADAGQSVPHLHVHILPRKKGDITPNDLIYDHLEAFGLGLKSDLECIQAGQEKALAPDADENRKSRTVEQMKEEADWLKLKLA